ncbi:hypothetical protein KM043_007637 [Ampulex compressa]|nr:hypothetical protein KM043_007637 [Ampulex compressa]
MFPGASSSLRYAPTGRVGGLDKVDYRPFRGSLAQQHDVSLSRSYCTRLEFRGQTRKYKDTKSSFACNDCAASFGTRSSLTYHVRHNCGKLRRCSYCGLVYKRLQDIKVHFKKHHPTLTFNVTTFRSS